MADTNVNESPDSVGYWVDLIVDMILTKNSRHSDRAGVTPFSRLATELCVEGRQCSEQVAIASAFLQLIINVPESVQYDPVRYWRSLYLLLPEQPQCKINLVNRFRARLFGKDALPENLQVFALNSLVKLGGVLAQGELDSLSFVREHNRVAWIKAVVLSKHFEYALAQMMKFVKSGTVTEPERNAFILNLTGWRSFWVANSELSEAQFNSAVVWLWQQAENGDGEDIKDALDKWLTIRDIIY